MFRAYYRNDSDVRAASFLHFSLLTPVNSLPRGATRLIPLALHAGLSTDEQLKVFEAAERDTRKVIVSTNIAEVRTFSRLWTAYQTVS